MDEFVAFLGAFIRFLFIYKCDYKQKKIAYDENSDEELQKDISAGFWGCLVIILISILIAILTGNVSYSDNTIQVEK